eukprot:6486071-Amphidinium_carterae.2
MLLRRAQSVQCTLFRMLPCVAMSSTGWSLAKQDLREACGDHKEQDQQSEHVLGDEESAKKVRSILLRAVVVGLFKKGVGLQSLSSCSPSGTMPSMSVRLLSRSVHSTGKAARTSNGAKVQCSMPTQAYIVLPKRQ